MTSLLSFRKGLTNQVMASLVTIFTFSLVTLICYVIFKRFVDVFATTPWYTAAIQAVANRFLFGIEMLDYVTLFVLIIIIIAICIKSYNTASSAAYFIIVFIMAPMIGFFAYVFNFSQA